MFDVKKPKQPVEPKPKKLSLKVKKVAAERRVAPIPYCMVAGTNTLHSKG